MVAIVPIFSYDVGSFNVSLGTNTDFQDRAWYSLGFDIKYGSVSEDFSPIESLRAGFGLYGKFLAHFPKDYSSLPEGVFGIEFVGGVYPALYYYLTDLQHLRVELDIELRFGFEPKDGDVAFGFGPSIIYTNGVSKHPLEFGFSILRISNEIFGYDSWTGYALTLLFGIGLI